MSNSPRILACLEGPRSLYHDPLFGPGEVLCGTGCQPAGTPDDPRAIQVEGNGGYDIRQVLRNLPGSHQPDVCLVHLSAAFSSFPTHLEAVRCPKVLLVGDTHQGRAPLERMIAYAQSTQFNLILSYCNRQHLHFFRAAGFERLAWLPLLLINPHPQPAMMRRAPTIAMVGQFGKHHPRRRKLVSRLAAVGLPIRATTCPQPEAAAIYASSLISLNQSRNGDTSLRILEVLSSGGFLVTEQLSPYAGLDHVLTDGKDAVLYESFDDLVDKLRYYLSRPELTEPIRRNGWERFQQQHAPAQKQRQLLEMVFAGRIPAEYDPEDEPRFRVAAPVGSARLGRRLDVYQAMQSLLVAEEQVTAFPVEVSEEVQRDLADLYRVVWREPATLEESHGANAVLLFGGVPTGAELTNSLTRFLGRWLIVSPDPERIPPAALAPVRDQLAAFGFFPVRDWPTLYERAGAWGAVVAFEGLGLAEATVRALGLFLDEREATVGQLMSGAIVAQRLGKGVLAEALARRAVAIDRADSSARHLLADILDTNGQGLAAAFQREQASRFAAAGDDESPFGSRQKRRSTNPTLRILVLTNLYPPQELGGYGRYIREYVEALRRRGHSVEVLTSNTPYLGEVAQTEDGIHRGVELFGGWRDGKVFQLADDDIRRVTDRNQRLVQRKAAEFAPDVCLLGNLDFVGLPAVASLAQMAPCLHHVGNRYTGYNPAVMTKIGRLRLAAASNWLRDRLIEDGFPDDGVAVLYPGGRCATFSIEEPPDFGTLRLLYASLVMPYKGAHVLVDALSRLHQQNVPFEATVAGDSTDPEFVRQLKEFCEREGFGEKVQFPGFLDTATLRRAHARHNVLVFPSVFEEPLGISQIEAMAAGLLVVSSGTGGAREVVRHRETGLLFSNGQAGELAAQLAMVYYAPEYAAQLAEAGRRAALAEFDVEVCAEALEAELIAMTKPAPARSG